MTTTPNPRTVAAQFVEDMSDFLISEGVPAKPGRNKVGTIGTLEGIDGWHVRLNRGFKIELGPHLDQAEKEAKDLGRAHAVLIQYRLAHDAGQQFAVMSVATLSRLLKRLEQVP